MWTKGNRQYSPLLDLVFVLAFVGGFMLLAALGNWLFKPATPGEKPAVITPDEGRYAQFPRLCRHCTKCKQCASPISETGEEQGLCEDGVRLLQEDMREALK